MIKKILLGLACILCFTKVYAQDDIEEFEYEREFIYGFNFNTNGGLLGFGGFLFKHARSISKNKYQSFGLEVVNVKHEKEIRIQAPRTGNYFIFGKQNYLYSLRLQYGREFVLFKKAPEEGVQINAVFSGGPSIGLLAPYYIRYEFQTDDIRLVPFDPNSTGNKENTLGTGRVFQGIDQSKVKLGLNLKSAISFEFGTFKNSVAGFEAGFLVEAFPEKIILMPTVRNKSLFSSAFFTLFYGGRR